MSTIPALGSGLLGIQRGLDHLRRDAGEIAAGGSNGNRPPGDITRPLVNLIEDRTQVAASTQVVKAVDETLGTLLDVSA